MIYYSSLVLITKDILIIFCSEVKIKRLFNMIKNVINYRQNWLKFKIIEIIMMMNYASTINNKLFKKKATSDLINGLFANELSNDVVDSLSFVIINDDSDSKEKANIWNNVLIDDMIDNKNDKNQYKNNGMLFHVYNNIVDFIFFIERLSWKQSCSMCSMSKFILSILFSKITLTYEVTSSNSFNDSSMNDESFVFDEDECDKILFRFV